jgi:malate/lactate dehydrogenase
MSVPVRLGRKGVTEIQEWELTADERAGLDRSADALAAAAKTVEESL